MWEQADRAFQRIWQQRRFSLADLDVIARAAAIDEGGNYLCILSRRYPREVFDALRAMYAAGNSSQRQAAIRTLTARLDRDAVHHLLVSAFSNDPNPNVRTAAAFHAARFGRRSFLAPLERQATREQPENQKWFAMACDVLRTGYTIEVHANGSRSIWVLTRRSGLVSATVDPAMASPAEIEAQVARVKLWKVR